MKLVAIDNNGNYLTKGNSYDCSPSFGGADYVNVAFTDNGKFNVPMFRHRFEEAPAPVLKDTNPKEKDPLGKDAHEPGSKLDHGKVRPALVLGGFARALLEVSKVGTFGATKYTDNGWQEVPNGVNRYDDANLRHWLTEKAGQPCDQDTKLLHAAHTAWNALARLDLIIRESERAE